MPDDNLAQKQLPTTNVGASYSPSGYGLGASALTASSNIFTNYLQHGWTREAWAQNEKVRLAQNAYNSREAQKQREAASVSSYIRQLKNAGLNLDLLYGAGSPQQGPMSAAQGSAIGSYLPANVQNPLTGVLDAFRSMEVFKTQLRKERAEAREAEADASIKESEANPKYLDFLLPKIQELEVGIKEKSIQHLESLSKQLDSMAKQLDELTNNAKKQGQLLDYDVLVQKALLTGEVDESLKNTKYWRHAQAQLDAEMARFGVEAQFPALDMLQIALEIKERYGDVDLNNIDSDINADTIAFFSQEMSKTLASITGKKDDAFWMDFVLSHLEDMTAVASDLTSTILTRGANKMVKETVRDTYDKNGKKTGSQHSFSRKRKPIN